MKNSTTFLALSFISMSLFLSCKEQQKDITESFTDNRDGKVYRTITVGNQTWFAENLAFKTNEGCWAPYGENGNVIKYGYLYYWETAKAACPIGWQIPSDTEWGILIDSLVAENILIEKGTIKYSNSLNAIFTNKSSYGGMFLGVAFSGMERIGWWWSSTMKSAEYAYTRVLHQGKNEFEKIEIPIIGYAVSIRCIKDK